MLTLAFDTSSKTAAVALLQDDTILYDVIINAGLNHSEVLLPAIDQACFQARIKITEIDLFACTLGPGSFTGLRIGVSTLKGLMLATGKPAVGISSLAALALNVSNNSKIICSIMNAGRGQVYVAYYRYNENGLLDQIGADKAIDPREIVHNNLEQEIIFVGDGAIRYTDIICNVKAKEVIIAPAQQQYIRASAVGILGRQKYDRNELLDAKTFVPVYLRSADARPKKGLFENC
jgi:tRNA threonylcarbamoyladenosine biosynthesis protein TsaB